MGNTTEDCSEPWVSALYLESGIAKSPYISLAIVKLWKKWGSVARNENNAREEERVREENANNTK